MSETSQRELFRDIVNTYIEKGKTSIGNFKLSDSETKKQQLQIMQHLYQIEKIVNKNS